MSPALACQFANYVEDQPRYEPPPVLPQEWVRPTVPDEKPPRSTGETGLSLVVNCVNCVHPGQAVIGLDDTYVFENRPVVARFIEEHRLHGLLLEAKELLKEKFGGGSVKNLAIISDDEGFETLLCLVVAPGTLQENRNALRSFDREWWLAQARHAAGRLNFDFRLL